MGEWERAIKLRQQWNQCFLLPPQTTNANALAHALSWMDIEKIRIGRSGGKEENEPVFCHVIPPESIGGPIIELEDRIRIAARKFHAVQEYSDISTW